MTINTVARKVKDLGKIKERAETISRERMAIDISGTNSARRLGSPSITTDEESEESELESDEYDDDDVFNDNDDDSEYVENGRNRMHGGASSSGLKTHASMLKHNDSEDSLSSIRKMAFLLARMIVVQVAPQVETNPLRED